MLLSNDRVFGSLLGLCLADALGSTFEGMEREQLQRRFDSPSAAIGYAMQRDSLRYTDDGQMTLVLAEYLSENSTIDPIELMRGFVREYEPWRGYGRGARALLEAFRDDAEYEFMAEHLFPGGSLGNGAAMRVAPVGLRFVGDIEKIREQAKLSAWPTHRHELGIEGAQLIALATSFAVTEEQVNPTILAEFLLPKCTTMVFQNRIRQLMHLKSLDGIEQFGNGIEAHESVVTALACFSLNPKDYRAAVAAAFWQGGDTDTIGAMTGALVGAHVGPAFSSSMPLERLEQGAAFVAQVRKLAERLT
jgi:poly(ADP-ribose) glycohydrolase ARH3